MNKKDKKKRRITFKKVFCYGVLIVILLILMIILPLSIHIYFSLKNKAQAEKELEVKLEELRESGYPTTFEELDEFYTHVPDEENAALVYQKAFDKYIPPKECDFSSLYPKKEDDPGKEEPFAEFTLTEKKHHDPNEMIPIIGDFPIPPPGYEFPEINKQYAETYLEANKECIELINKAVQMKKCRFDIDFSEGFAIRVAHMSKLRQLNRLLVLETLLAGENGNSKKCVENFESMMGICSALDNEPILLSFLVRVALYVRSIKSLEDSLSRTKYTDKQLVRLSNALAAVKTPDVLPRALKGELVIFIDTDMGKLIEDDFDRWDKEVLFLYYTQKFSPVWVNAKINYIDYLLPIIESSERSSSAAVLQVGNQIEKLNIEINKVRKTLNPIDNYPYIMLDMLLPTMKSGIERESELLALSSEAFTALTIERYRLKNGYLPDYLSLLVPEFLAEIPKDPFTEKELKYVKGDFKYFLDKDFEMAGIRPETFTLPQTFNLTGFSFRNDEELKFLPYNGYNIYSVGKDCKDDKGMKYREHGDISFKVGSPVSEKSSPPKN